MLVIHQVGPGVHRSRAADRSRSFVSYHISSSFLTFGWLVPGKRSIELKHVSSHLIKQLLLVHIPYHATLLLSALQLGAEIGWACLDPYR